MPFSDGVCRHVCISDAYSGDAETDDRLGEMDLDLRTGLTARGRGAPCTQGKDKQSPIVGEQYHESHMAVSEQTGKEKRI